MDASRQYDIRNEGSVASRDWIDYTGGGGGCYNGGGAPASDTETLSVNLVRDSSTVLGLTDLNMLSRPVDLFPSGQFLLVLSRRCVESAFPPLFDEGALAKAAAPLDCTRSYGVHYLILFLDEILDLKHPSVTRWCVLGLERLVGEVGVVLVVTHKLQHWECLDL